PQRRLFSRSTLTERTRKEDRQREERNCYDDPHHTLCDPDIEHGGGGILRIVMNHALAALGITGGHHFGQLLRARRLAAEAQARAVIVVPVDALDISHARFVERPQRAAARTADPLAIVLD